MVRHFLPGLLVLGACAEKGTVNFGEDTDRVVDSEVVVDSEPVDTEPAFDPCEINPCTHGGTCEPDGIEPVCTCHNGYEGNTCDFKSFFVGDNVEGSESAFWQPVGQHTRVQLIVSDAVAPQTRTQIAAVSFRRLVVDGEDNEHALAIPRVAVKIGHAVPNLVTPFDANFQGEAHAAYTGPATIAPVTDALAFDAWTIPVDPPFVFDPALGRLILDISMQHAGSLGASNDGVEYVPLNCNNDATISIRSTREPFHSQTNAPPVDAYSTNGCGWVMRLGTLAP